MEKLNKVGLEVLEHKRELLNDNHSSIVQHALYGAVTNLLSSEIINVDIHDALRDKTMTSKEVYSMMLETNNLIKTSEELKAEYEILRKPFHEKLVAIDGITAENFARLSTESHVKEEEIQVILSFEMSKEFIGDYFEREGEYLDFIMKSEGFAEKFAILRYGALMMKFLRKQDKFDDTRKRAIFEDNVELGTTKVYVNKDEVLYGVELVMHIPVENLEDKELTEKLYPLLEEKIKEANEYVNIRTIA